MTQSRRSIDNAKQRDRRARSGNAATRKYEKTKNGFLMRLHRNIRSRVLGIQKAKSHLYAHIDNVVDRKDFYEWSLSSQKFHALFDEWVASGYDRKKTPSVDRVDPAGGYSFDNMEWVTHSENSRRSSVTRKAKQPGNTFDYCV